MTDSAPQDPTTIDSVVRAVARADQRLRLPIGAVLADTYELIARIGQGGMSVVFRARDRRLGRDVAIKALPSGAPQLRTLFEREARATAQLRHPNIVTLHDIGEHEGHPYLVLELLTGRTVAAGGRVPVAEALALFDGVLRGLAYAHERGVLHRDLKPSNLFVTSDGEVKILDFGVAKLVGAPVAEAVAPAIGDATLSGSLVGTLGYMSPEQVRGDVVDQRSDLFNFGATAYEMLTGRRAFAGATYSELIEAILERDVPAMPGSVPMWLQRIVRRCLAKDREARFQSAAEIRTVLAAHARQRRRWIAAGAIGVAAAAVTIAAISRRAPSRVSAAPAPHFTRVTFNENVVRLDSRFMPDERRFVYTEFDNGEPTIYISSLSGEDARPLGITSAILRDVSRSGELLVTRHDGPLVWGRGIPGRLERIPPAGGRGQVIATDVTAASWGPDGDEIALIRALAAGSEIEWPAGHAVYRSPLVLRQVAVSPRGDRLAFVEYTRAVAAHHPRDFRGRIVTLDRAGTRRAITDELGAVCCLAWSHSGQRIFFSGSAMGPKLGVWEATLDGGAHLLIESADDLSVGDVSADERRLLVASSGDRQFLHVERAQSVLDLGAPFGHATDISDDGTWVVVEGDPGRDVVERKLYLRATDGSSSRVLGEGLSPRLSPDRTRMVVGSVAQRASLRIVPLDGSRARELPTGGLVVREAAMWLPDGRRIVYAGTTPAGGQRLYVQDVDGGEPRAFGPPGAMFEGAISGKLVAPDGRTVAARDGERWSLVSIATSAVQPLPMLTSEESVRQWSADGKQLYVTGPSTAVRSLERLDLATGARTRIAALGEQTAGWRGGIEHVFVDREGSCRVYSTMTSHVDLYLVDR